MIIDTTEKMKRIEALPVGCAAIVDRNLEMITIPLEVAKALDYFVKNNESGTVLVQFKNGGFAGVETNTRKILK
jgi:hypothetical protein